MANDEAQSMAAAFMHIAYRVMAAHLDADDDTIDAIMTSKHRRAAVDGLAFLAMDTLRARFPGVGDREILIRLVADTLPDAMLADLDELP
jgi:hypothetical protein